MSDVTKSIWIDAPPGIVFPYFTDADKMARWCGTRAELNPVPRGMYRLDMGEVGVIAGRFVSIEPDTFVSYEVDGPVGGGVPPSLVEITLTPESGGTRVDIRQTGLEPPFNRMASRGWDHHLARLSVAATDGSPGDDSLCARQLDSLT